MNQNQRPKSGQLKTVGEMRKEIEYLQTPPALTHVNIILRVHIPGKASNLAILCNPT